MTRIHQAILVAGITLVGLWGCTRPAASTADAGRLKQLETRVSKLETDLRDMTADRDVYRTRLTSAERTADDLRSKLTAAEARAKAAETDRDRLTVALKLKTTEREQVQAQFDAFRKSLKELVGQSETAAVTARLN